VHHSSTFTHMSNVIEIGLFFYYVYGCSYWFTFVKLAIEIEETFCGRTDIWDPLGHFITSTLLSYCH